MNLKGKKVIIDAVWYLSLLEKADELDALECMGVDNWGGYGEHIEIMNESEEDRLKEVRSRIIEDI